MNRCNEINQMKELFYQTIEALQCLQLMYMHMIQALESAILNHT